MRKELFATYLIYTLLHKRLGFQALINVRFIGMLYKGNLFVMLTDDPN